MNAIAQPAPGRRIKYVISVSNPAARERAFAAAAITGPGVKIRIRREVELDGDDQAFVQFVAECTYQHRTGLVSVIARETGGTEYEAADKLEAAIRRQYEGRLPESLS